jgi:cleavage and polyadenylation specificity factor subunit 1
VIAVASNSLIHVSQTGRRTVLSVNGWASRVSDMPIPALTGDDLERNLKLEGSCATFIDEKALYIVLKDGSIYPVEIIAEGRTVSQLNIGAPIARTTIPSVVKSTPGEHLFIGSIVGPSVLLKTLKVEVEIQEEDVDMHSAPTAVVDSTDIMDFDDDDGMLSEYLNRGFYSFCTDLYGTAGKDNEPAKGVSNGVNVSTKTRTVIHLSLCDSIPGHGAISDMVFSLSRNGVSNICYFKLFLFHETRGYRIVLSPN